MMPKKNQYSVEFCHIYSDENDINGSQLASIDYLKSASSAWNFDYDLVVLIDDYNPKTHNLSEKKIIESLRKKGVEPHFLAYESTLASNAEVLLGAIEQPKLKKNYKGYITAHSKYPCSLLTASWYLTRLGKFESKNIILPVNGKEFLPAKKLINILPCYYKPIEARALDIIAATKYKDALHNIQNLFYEDKPANKADLY